MSGGHYEYMQWDPGINWKIINGLEEILKDLEEHRLPGVEQYQKLLDQANAFKDEWERFEPLTKSLDWALSGDSNTDDYIEDFNKWLSDLGGGK